LATIILHVEGLDTIGQGLEPTKSMPPTDINLLSCASASFTSHYTFIGKFYSCTSALLTIIW
jgi:hypothetical protein